MKDRLPDSVHPSPPRPRRGRPLGSTKTRDQDVQDRIRTVATLNHAFIKVCCANNLAQFSRWFDESMYARYPGRTWNTNVSNKWRKNFYGTVAMTEEWLQYLGELLPDGQYYSGHGGSDDWSKARPLYPDPDTASDVMGATAMFSDGPGQLWKAIWQSTDHAEWSADSYEAALDDLEMKLYSDFDCHEPITYQDLACAVVLYRAQLPTDDYPMPAYPFEWGIRAYLCLKLAIAANQPDVLGVMPDIANYFADIELQRLRTNTDYAFAIRKEWMRRGMSSAPSIGKYVINPFLSLWDQCANERLYRRYAGLASLTARSLRPLK